LKKIQISLNPINQSINQIKLGEYIQDFCYFVLAKCCQFQTKSIKIDFLLEILVNFAKLGKNFICFYFIEFL